MLFRGVPTGPVPPTPLKNTLGIGAGTVLAERMRALVPGTLVAYKEEANGALFQDVVPVPALETAQTSTGSRVPLEIHTEQAFSEARPDFLALGCLRGDPGATTYTLDLETLVRHLTPEELEMLQRPLWTIGVDLSFRMNGWPGDRVGPVAILRDGGRRLVFDQDLMEGLTPEAHGLIGRIVAIYEAHRVGYVLEPGDVLVIDNRTTVHGRSAFEPRFDGTDRFLVRCFSKYTV